MEQFEKIYLYRRIVKAKLFIDENYSERIDLNNISDQAHFSKFHFIRLFKSIYGFTPNNYLVKIRVDNAKIFLTEGYSISETSSMIGFESPTTFSGTFRKIVGMSPSAFQKEQEIRKLEIKRNPFQFVPNCFAESHGWTNQQY